MEVENKIPYIKTYRNGMVEIFTGDMHLYTGIEGGKLFEKILKEKMESIGKKLDTLNKKKKWK